MRLPFLAADQITGLHLDGVIDAEDGLNVADAVMGYLRHMQQAVIVATTVDKGAIRLNGHNLALHHISDLRLQVLSKQHSSAGAVLRMQRELGRPGQSQANKTSV